MTSSLSLYSIKTISEKQEKKTRLPQKLKAILTGAEGFLYNSLMPAFLLEHRVFLLSVPIPIPCRFPLSLPELLFCLLTFSCSVVNTAGLCLNLKCRIIGRSNIESGGALM